jgi:hypothetical protein
MTPISHSYDAIAQHTIEHRTPSDRKQVKRPGDEKK